jgi:3-dehydroquinate dehydratase II
MASLVYVLNGPNLNLLGTREPELYGSDTLADIEKLCRAAAAKHGLEVVFRQTKAAGVLLNAGAYTHTSVAILDAIRATTMPVIEVHLSNPFAREQFRHHSFVSPAAKGLICGFGAHSYVLAIDALAGVLRTAKA